METEEIKKWASSFETVYWAGGMPWAVEGGLLSPVVMPHAIGPVEQGEVKEILKQSGAILATWTSNWDSLPGEWWFTCCDIKNYDLDKVENQRGKRSVKSGLKNCEVRKVAAPEFAKAAHAILVEAMETYDGYESQIPTEQAYIEFIMRKAQFPGTEYWGAFVDGKMVAFSTCFFVNNAVSLGSTKSLKAYNNLNVNSALFFEICRHYLNERGALYVSNGRRNLLHPTSINDFLERMGFRKVYGTMHIELSPTAKWIGRSGVAKWGKFVGLNKLRPSLWDKIEGFGKLMDIKKAFEKV